MKVIDLSHTIEPEMTVYPGTPRPALKPIASHVSHGYAELQFTITTHTGTHVDVPYHIFSKGKQLDQLEVSRFMGKAVCVKASGEHITLDFVKNLELDNVDFVIFYTGMAKYWKTDDYLTKRFAVLTEQAADYLVGKGLKGIGIDAVSIDRVDSQSLPVHRILLGNGLVIVENLTNLEFLVGKRFNFYALPLKILSADGSPVRAVAILDGV